MIGARGRCRSPRGRRRARLGRAARELDDLLQDVLARRRPAGCALPATTICSGSASSRSRSVKTSAGPLVRGEAAREADREAADGSRPVRAASRCRSVARTRQRALGIDVAAQPPTRPPDGGASGRTPAVRSSASSSGASHVPRWTPFVMWPIGAPRAGESPAHISRATSPCRAETPFAHAESRSASGVRPKSSVPFDSTQAEQLLGGDARLAAGPPRVAAARALLRTPRSRRAPACAS